MLPKTKSAAFNESDVVMYLATALKHVRLMALLICFSMLLGIDYYVYSRSVYFAKSLIHYQSFVRPVDSEAIWKDSNDRTLFGTLKSPQVIERTAKRLGLSSNPNVLYTKYLKREPRLARDPNQKDITVEVYAYSARIARDWAPTMLAEYIAYRDERRLEYAENAIKAYTEDIGQYKSRMDKALDQKYAFEQKNSMDKLLIELDELRQVPQELALIQHRLATMNRIRESLNAEDRDSVAKLALLDSLESDIAAVSAKNLNSSSMQLGVGQVVAAPSTENTSAAPDVVVLPSMVNPVSTKEWAPLDKERHRIQQELTLKGKNLLPGNPQIIQLQKQLDAVNKSLDLEFNVAYDSFNLEYSHLLEKQKQLQQKMPDYQEITRRHEKLITEYKQFDSGQLAWRKFYNNESQRLDALDFGFDKDRAELSFDRHLIYKDTPVSPNRSKLILYSFLLGLALAIAIPFLLEYLNGRVSDVEQAEETLRIRGLGVVPKVTDVPFDKLILETSEADTPDHHLKESFRLIRTNLVINSESGALPQVILVTSSMPQEGKTVVAANLALSFAAKGEKTLLIDGDLRRGRVHKLFDIQNKPGLSNMLGGQATLDQITRVNGHENLTIMTCGKHLNSASELLDSQAFTNLMTELRSKYQRIILDSPPVLGLSETLIMQRFADGVLMVIWSDFTPMSSVKSAMQSLQVNGAKFAGFVLNRLDFSALTNRYKYFYYAPLYYANYQPLPAPATTAKVD
jgi:capsular exopolysaccharide synthesis family protein